MVFSIRHSYIRNTVQQRGEVTSRSSHQYSYSLKLLKKEHFELKQLKKFKMNKVAIIAIVAFFTIVINENQVDADCCHNKFTVHHKCSVPMRPHESVEFTRNGNLHCSSVICPDGLGLVPLDHYCGVGSCNIFGCNCDGGCRRNSVGISSTEAIEEAINLFKERYNVDFATFHP